MAFDLTAEHLLNPGVVIGPKEHNAVHLFLHRRPFAVSGGKANLARPGGEALHLRPHRITNPKIQS